MIHYSRVEAWGPWFAAVAVVMSFLLFGLAGVYTFRQQEHVSSRLCEITSQNRNSTRASWEAVREVLLRNIDNDASMSDRQKETARVRTHVFVDEVLNPIPPLICVDNQPVPKED